MAKTHSEGVFEPCISSSLKINAHLAIQSTLISTTLLSSFKSLQHLWNNMNNLKYVLNGKGGGGIHVHVRCLFAYLVELIKALYIPCLCSKNCLASIYTEFDRKNMALSWNVKHILLLWLS